MISSRITRRRIFVRPPSCMLSVSGRTVVVVRRIVLCVAGLRLFALAVHMLAAGARVSTVATFRGSQGFEAEVATDTILVVRGDVLVVVEEVVDFAVPPPLIVVNLVVLVLLLELPQPIFARHVLLLEKPAAVCDLVTRVRAAGKHARSWRMIRGSGLLNYREG